MSRRDFAFVAVGRFLAVERYREASLPSPIHRPWVWLDRTAGMTGRTPRRLGRRLDRSTGREEIFSGPSVVTCGMWGWVSCSRAVQGSPLWQEARVRQAICRGPNRRGAPGCTP